MFTRLLAPVLFLAFAAPAPGFGATFFVDPAGNDGNDCLSAGTACLTLQAAIDKAAAGDTIEVAAGTYPVAGVVTVNKQLTLRGAQAGVDARGRAGAESVLQNGGGLNVTASDTVVDGFTIENSTSQAFTGYGVLLGAGTSGVQVLNNVIQNNIVGIGLANTGASQAVIRRNVIRDNNQTGGASGTGIYTDQFVAQGTVSNVLIAENEFTGHDDAAIGFSSTDPTRPATNVTVSGNVSDGNGRLLYAFSLTNSTVRDNDVVNSTFVGSADLRLFEGVSGLTVTGNRFANGTGRLLRASDIGTGAASATGVSLTYNTIAGYADDAIELDAGGYTGPLVATCNHWGDASGPTIATNPGGSGASIDDAAAQVTFLPWLVNGVDGAATVGYQLQAPYLVGDTPNGTESPADNDYRRLSNALGCAVDGQTIELAGTFDWTEANAAASWALGSDNVPSIADDYSILVRPNLNGVTLTAASLGAAQVQGPGDLAAVNLEGVLVFNGGDNQSWTISNLQFSGFDLTIGMFNGAGGSDAFAGTTITNNAIVVPTDLNATVAPADVNQNIGIHFSFGQNQQITNNAIDFPGDGVSDSANLQFASSVGMQSNTSGGSVYDGLLIDGNTLRVLNAQSADPETILGIWENAHGHTSDVTVSDNTFTNLAPGNDPALNLQRAFRVTSHSGAGTTVLYQGNTVEGANVGFQWLAGSNFAGHQPVQLASNTLDGTGTGVLVQSNGSANVTMNAITGGGIGVDLVTGSATLSCNSITGNTTGIRSAIAAATAFDNAIVGNGTGIDGSAVPAGTPMDAEGNWWGCAAGPGNPGCDTVTGNVDFTPVLGALPACVSCTSDAECADGLACNGDEVCNTGTGMCEAGTPPACGLGPADPQCNTAGCVEPTGCVVTPVADGTTCTFAPADTCSVADTCQAGVCTAGGGGDADGDGLCAADDNCPADANPGQEDLDNDGEGDVCDADDAALNLTRVRLIRPRRPDRPTGSVSAKGDFLTDPPADVLDPSGGITLRFRDALGLDVSATIDTCKVQTNGRVRCTRADKTARAFFRPIAGTPGAYRFDVRITKLLITPPFQAPVEVTIHQDADGIDRVDTISSCAASAKGLTCKEP